MDSITRNKRLRWTVILLIVMNVVSLIVLWIGHTGRPDKGNGPGGGGQFLEQRLSLSPEQTAKLQALRQSHFDRMNTLKREFHDSRKELHALWKSENSAAQADGLAEKIGDLQAGIELEIFTHFSDIRALCNEEQIQVFDSIIEEVLRGGEERNGPKGNLPPPGQGPGPGGNLPPVKGR